MAPDSTSSTTSAVAPVRNAGANAERDGTTDDGRRTDSGSGPDDRRTVRSRPVTDGESPDRTHACPLCGYADENRDSVFTHLLLSHRKRAISSALLEAHTRE